MRPCYLLLVPNEPAIAGGLRNREAERAAERTGLEVAWSGSGSALLTNPACRWLAVGGGAGVIVGNLFPRHGPPRPLDRLAAEESRSILGTEGGALLTRCWGGYIAAVPSGRRIRVLREPSAAMPCWFARTADLTAFASDAALLADLGLASARIDWQGLVRHLSAGGVPSASTGLEGIFELLPGHSIETGLPDRQRPCWSPWDYVRAGQVESGAAAEQLRRIVGHCEAAWAAPYSKPLLSVSGGLDSSIVAACLAGRSVPAVCLTLFGEDRGGDEREYARLLCQSLGLRLIERPYRLEDIDLAEPLAPHLPRPIGRTQGLAFEKVHHAVADEIGADAFLSGNGGDSVFGFSQSAAAVADRFLAEGIGSGVLRSLLDLCRQTGCSLAQGAAAARRIARGPRSYLCRPNHLFLAPEARPLKDWPMQHAWLDAPVDALPGKAAHIASILRVQQCLEPGRSRRMPVLNPLMSQPVIEACLAVPSWEWRAGGRDRSLARRAFEGTVPAPVLHRRVKGGPDAFAARLLDTFRRQVRERLREGQMARQRLLDEAALERALATDRPIGGDARVRILELVATEAWIEHWTSRGGLSGGQPPREASTVTARR